MTAKYVCDACIHYKYVYLYSNLNIKFFCKYFCK